MDNDNLARSFLDLPTDTGFPIQNLPYGIFGPIAGGKRRVGVAIGEWVLDLAVLEARGLFQGVHLGETNVFNQPTLNAFMALGHSAWAAVRNRIRSLLVEGNPLLRDDAELRSLALVLMQGVRLFMPVEIGDYTDFYSSKFHAANVGAMFRPDAEPIFANWSHMPISYHGRASSVILSGQGIRRPRGQIKTQENESPLFAPTAELDFELEVGFIVGMSNDLGQPVPVQNAHDHIFGVVLVNDWSARDIQRWEYRPLGPFLSKNFATSISPWVIPLAALAPFRRPGPVQEPAPLPYLEDRQAWNYDINLEVEIQSPEMSRPVVVTQSNARYLYWNIRQQVAHHTINGCNLRPGDLLASGTISGPEPGTYGSLLEISWRGTRPITLAEGQERVFLKDGDRVTMRGWCQGAGYRVGLGEVTAVVLPAN